MKGPTTELHLEQKNGDKKTEGGRARGGGEGGEVGATASLFTSTRVGCPRQKHRERRWRRAYVYGC